MANFRTLPEEMVGLAELAEEYFGFRGFAVKREKSDLAFPFTPALFCRRTPTRLIVDVSGKFEEARLLTWAAFGRSCSSDTQFALVTPNDGEVMSRVPWFTSHRLGLYTLETGNLVEILPPQDLAMLMELPNLADADPSTRRALGPAYEQIGRGHWREGFETACVALEQLARKHFKEAVVAGRTFRRKSGRLRSVTAAQVSKMTLGQLGNLATEASPMTLIDSTLAKALPRINDERVSVAHKKYTREALLRRHVGNHMWVIYNSLQRLAI